MVLNAITLPLVKCWWLHITGIASPQHFIQPFRVCDAFSDPLPALSLSAHCPPIHRSVSSSFIQPLMHSLETPFRNLTHNLRISRLASKANHLLTKQTGVQKNTNPGRTATNCLHDSPDTRSRGLMRSPGLTSHCTLSKLLHCPSVMLLVLVTQQPFLLQFLCRIYLCTLCPRFPLCSPLSLII